MVYKTTFNQITSMNHYKDDCHHYKVIDDHKVITVLLLGGHEISISYENYSHLEHHIISDIKNGKVTPCTESEYQTAFDKALNTIKKLKS